MTITGESWAAGAATVVAVYLILCWTMIQTIGLFRSLATVVATLRGRLPGQHLLFVRCPDKNWYCDEAWDRVQALLQDRVQSRFAPDQVTCWYGSMGGHGALKAALAFGWRAIVFNPQTDLDLWAAFRPRERALQPRTRRQSDTASTRSTQMRAFSTRSPAPEASAIEVSSGDLSGPASTSWLRPMVLSARAALPMLPGWEVRTSTQRMRSSIVGSVSVVKTRPALCTSAARAAMHDTPLLRAESQPGRAPVKPTGD